MEFYLDPDLWVAPEEGACPMDSPQKGDNVSPMTMTKEGRRYARRYTNNKTGDDKRRARRWERRARKQVGSLPRRALTGWDII